MSYFGDYQRKAIQPGYVDQEGDYQVKVIGFNEGVINSKDGSQKKYVQVKCLVNHRARPSVSIFLTEGETFNGNFTAFCDTFGINCQADPNSWIGKTGWIHIMLTKKDGFTNMVPRWILNDQGFVRDDVKAGANSNGMQQQTSVKDNYGDCSEQEFGDIPF